MTAVLAAGGALAWIAAASAAPAAKGLEAPKSAREVAVTVYNDNLGVVKDKRTFPVASGISELRFTDVAALIDPTSVHLRGLGKSPV